MNLLEIIASVNGDWDKLPELVMPEVKETPEGKCYYCDEPFEREATAILTGYKLNSHYTNWSDYKSLADDCEHIDRKANYLYSKHCTQIERPVCEYHHTYCEWCSDAYCPILISDSVRVPNLSTRHSNDNWALHFSAVGGYATGWNWDATLCLSCTENAGTCERCLGLVDRENDDYCDVQGEMWCETCTSERAQWCEWCETYETDPCEDNVYESNTRGGVHDYGYKPDAIFGYVDSDLYDYHTPEGTSINYRTKGIPFMGFELEVEAGNADIREGIDALQQHLGSDENYVYLKTDGSLDRGFEIVSHPATLASHKTRKLAEALGALSAQGFRSWRTNTCGIHVHVARASFANPSHIWKFTHLIVDNKDAMIKLAGRDSDRWASFNLESYAGNGVKNRAKGSQYYNRYEAINFGNARTLELRFFRGSLKVERLLSALELTEGAVEYTRNLSVQDVINGGLDFAKFVTWLRERSDKYPNLLSYVDTLGIAEHVRDRQPKEVSYDYF